MEWVSLALSGLSLVAVLLIGWRTLLAMKDSNMIMGQSAEATRHSAEATDRSAIVTERVLQQADRQAHELRLGYMLDVLFEMRDLFNQQEVGRDPNWMPGYLSPESLKRLALSRQLEGRLVPLEDDFDQQSMVRYLARAQQWTSTQFEEAILEVKTLLRNTTAAL